MRVLVTGGAGFIGSHIVDLLLARGHDVMIFDIAASPYEDITIPGLIDDRVARYRPDVICHQAAQASLRRSIDDPAYDATVNILGTLNVVQAAERHGVKHMVFASTSAVYAPYAQGQFDEMSQIGPTTPYGISKRAAEMYIAQQTAMSYTALRYGNVYGPGQVAIGENQLIPRCLDHIFRDVPFCINGTGDQGRDYVYVKDIAAANVAAIERQITGRYNCGTGRSMTVLKVCQAIKDQTGWGGDYSHAGPVVGEAPWVTLDSSAADRHLDWRATTPFHAGLAQTIAWYKQGLPQ